MSTKPFNAFAMAQAQFDRIAELLELDQGTRDLLRQRKLPKRDAAHVIAIGRVAQACRDRGWV